MKPGVIFDTNFGSTKKIAETIAKILKTKAISVSDITDNDLKETDLLIVGSPIIGWMPTVKVQTFLSNLKAEQLSGMKFATFDTRVKLFIHGDAMKKIASKLTSLGATQLTDPVAFYVKNKEGTLLDGETDKAATWAELIKQAMTDSNK